MSLRDISSIPGAASSTSAPDRRSLWLWTTIALLTLALAWSAAPLAEATGAIWLIAVPDALLIDMKGAVRGFMAWLVDRAHFGLFTFRDVTRAISSALDVPYQAARFIIVEGWVEGRGRRQVTHFPPLSWIAIVFAVAAMGTYAKNWKLGLFVGGCFFYLAVFGQWHSAMVTLASIVIAVPIGVLGGMMLGTGAYLWPRMDRALTPLLDMMQTVPTFAYLVPILFLFGFGPVAALIATVIYAMPPMVRMTTLALRSVPDEIREFSVMVGCTGRQRILRVLLPAASPDLMVGVNQVIMLSLNMVIIASMIGAGGLGFDVLTALRRLDIGGGIEAGLAIVALAVALDRLSQAFASRSRSRTGSDDAGRPWLPRHPWLATVAAIALVTGLLGTVLPPLQSYPLEAMISTGAFWDALVRTINITYYDQLEAVKNAVLLNVLLPVKRFMLTLPWLWVLVLVTLAGWQLGRARLALLCLLLGLFIVVNDLWVEAMTTIYLCGVSVVIAAIIGIPLGVVAAATERGGRLIGGFIDTLQTLPSFVYLIPVVMLFRVGDFAAMIAVVLYALAPAVRYTAHGLRSVSPDLIEAGTVCGCTRWQLLTRIRLPLALPEIMLGINQTIMLALSMLVITALVGTRDLGQEVYIALTRADTGQGIVAGLAIAAIAIIADRLIAAGARRTRTRLGMEGGPR